MIARDAVPIGHTPPLPPIDINPRAAVTDPNAPSCADVSYSPTECDRIMDLIRQAASSGGNLSPVDLDRLSAPL